MEFIRGDTFKFKFRRKNLNNEIIMTKSQKLWFTIKKSYKTSVILVQKKLEDNTITFDEEGFYHVVIEPKDTKPLKYKKYVCDIQVENNGEVTTIYKGIVKLLEEVTFEGGES